MKKWSFVIDVAKCHDCNNCFLACKDEYFDNDYPPYSVAQPRHGIVGWTFSARSGAVSEGGYGYLPYPACTAMTPVHAENQGDYQERRRIVLIDPQKAKGKKEIVESCPYG